MPVKSEGTGLVDLTILQTLLKSGNSKILLLVLDGLGGLPDPQNGQTELEAARIPNLDRLAEASICGLHVPVGIGLTPGSGPSHLALFGYDPLRYQVGRGVLSALGVNFDLRPEDVAARGNFCTVDESGIVTDRRAGRISTEKNRQLCGLLREIRAEGAEIFVETEKEHRFLFVLRGRGLDGRINDTDPQQTGLKPRAAEALAPEARRTASIVNQFAGKARAKLRDEHPANMLLLRGFSKHPDWPTMQEVFGLNPAAIAAYPMYRGVARLVGMKVLETGETFEEELETLRRHWDEHDFFFLHFKKTDSAGEDGDFNRKKEAIETVDSRLPEILDLGPDVLIVTGDHSTPAVMKQHSWHPVPTLLWSKRCRPDEVKRFGERACLHGALGPAFPATDLMPLALANAGRLEKFGA